MDLVQGSWRTECFIYEACFSSQAPFKSDTPCGVRAISCKCRTKKLYTILQAFSGIRAQLQACVLCILQGDHLEALAPFVANKQQGKTFKFMFVGEDDTLFFREGARTALSGLQETLPYFISGKLVAEQL